jgi:bifunctional non-homologous end joining protein LigD
MKKAIRTNKVFVDWSQNDEHKTTISVYSLRARERPTVSTPVTWDEVDRAMKKRDAGLLVFEADAVVKRVEKMGDLFSPLLTLKQKLPKLAGIEDASSAEVEIAAQAEKPRSAKRKPSAQVKGNRRVRRKV